MHHSKLKTVIIILISATVLLAHLWMGYIAFHHPYLGIEVTSTISESWFISELYTGGIAKNIGLKLGDEIVSINNRPASDHFTIPLFHSVEQVLHIEILREERSLEFDLAGVQNVWLPRSVVSYITGLIFTIVAAHISIKHMKTGLKKSTLLFAMVCTSIGLALMSAEASSRSDLLARFLTLSSMSLMPLLLIHYLHQMLSEKGQSYLPFKWIKLGYWLVLPFCLLRVIYFTPAASYTYYSLDRLVALLFFAVGSACSLGFLLFMYRKRRYEYSYSAKIIKTIFIAFGLSFVPFIVLSVVPDMVADPLVDYHYTLLFIVLFPIFLLYFAHRNHLIHLRRLSITRYVAIVSRGTIFYRKHPMFVAVQHMIANLSKLQGFQELRNSFLPELCQAFSLNHAAIFIKDEEEATILRYGTLDETQLMQAIDSNIYSTGNSQILHLAAHENYSCYLIIENKSGSSLIHGKMEQWLEMILSPLAIVIENIYLSKRLSVEKGGFTEAQADSLWMKKFAFQLQELERSRVAAELHDTVMQDIYFAKQRVMLIRRQLNQGLDIKDQLLQLDEYLDIINSNTREAVFQLYPSQLENTGFSAAISNLVEQERSHVEFDIQLYFSQPDSWDEPAEETQLQLFRIIQELLTNARKHSHAHTVKLHFDNNEGQYWFRYQDDGVGLNRKPHRKSLGWSGIQQRVASIGARIHVKSFSYPGLDITINLDRKGVPLTHEENASHRDY